MKAKLVIEMPNCCNYCPLFNDKWSTCKFEEKSIEDDNEKPDWCPLVPVEVKDNTVQNFRQIEIPDNCTTCKYATWDHRMEVYICEKYDVKYLGSEPIVYVCDDYESYD